MKFVFIFFSVFSFLSFSLAEETLSQKANVEVNAIGQKARKVVDHTEETVCGTLTGDNKIQCLAKKGKHRINEGVGAMKDKASEMKDKVETK